MATERSDAFEMDDAALNDALFAPPLEELDGLSIQQQRLARIQEYEEEAVARPDPFAAMIGMGNADLQRMFEHLGSAILNEFETRAPTIEDIRERGPEISLMLKLRNAIQFDLAVQNLDMRQQSGIIPHSHGRRQLDNKGPCYQT